MVLLFSQIDGQLLDCKKPDCKGRLVALYIYRDSGKLSYVKSKYLEQEYDISVLDIMIWNEQKAIIREISTQIEQDVSIDILGMKVINQDNKLIGWIEDFSFNSDLSVLDSIYIKGRWINLWKKRIMPRVNIIEIKNDYVKVNDLNMDRWLAVE